MISIALASYNGEKFLAEQIDSILRQTIQDFELVVCDDCSVDNTWNILQEYEKKDSRIHCYKNEKNVGLVKNFERAMHLCKGDYIAFSDQDDIWTDDHLQVLMENIGDNIACCGDAILIEKGVLTDKLSIRNGGDIAQLDTSEKKLKRMLHSCSPYQGASMLMKRSFCEEIFPFPDINMHDVWVAFYACVNNRLVYVEKVITHYRQHSTQRTHHEKRSVFYDLKKLNFKKYTQNERSLYIDSLLQRFPDMDEANKKILCEARRYFLNIPIRWRRFKYIRFWIKTYSHRFPGQSRKLLIPKLIRFLFI